MKDGGDDPTSTQRPLNDLCWLPTLTGSFIPGQGAIGHISCEQILLHIDEYFYKLINGKKQGFFLISDNN